MVFILTKLILLVVKICDVSIVLVLVGITLLHQVTLRQQSTYTLINIISSIQSGILTLDWINSWVITSLSLIIIVLLSLLNDLLIVTLFIMNTFGNSVLLTSKFFVASLDSTFDQRVIERVVKTLSNCRQAMPNLGLLFICVFPQVSVLTVDLVLILLYLTLCPSLFLLVLIILPHQQIIIANLNLLLVFRVILVSLNLSLHGSILRLSVTIYISV